MKTPFHFASNSSSPREDIAIRSLLEVQARQSEANEWNNNLSPRHCLKPNNVSSSFSKILGGNSSRNYSSFSIKQKLSPRNSIQSIQMIPAVIQMSDSDKVILHDRNSIKNNKSQRNSNQKQIYGNKAHLSNRHHQYARVISKSGEKQINRKEGRVFDQYRFGLIKSLIDNGEEFIRYKEEIFDKDKNNCQQSTFYNTQTRDNNPFALRHYFLRKSLSVGHSPKQSELSIQSQLKKTYQKICKNNQNADQNQSITVRHLLKNLQQIQKKKQNCLPSSTRSKSKPKAIQNDSLKIRKLRYEQYGHQKYKELMDNLKISHSKQKEGKSQKVTSHETNLEKGNSVLDLNKQIQSTSRHFRKNSNQRK